MTDATRRTLRTAVQTLVALVPLLAGEPAARDAPRSPAWWRSPPR
ncbi:hypothetical protein O1M54_23760 [Streptomyces diastatochromogenes]|nr:hypothetical protein [Streptomyces diastatochromogenes]